MSSIDNGTRVTATAPGRVNLVGDHTDYMGGLALPMAVQMCTTVTGLRTGSSIELTSEGFDSAVSIELPVGDPTAVVPPWGRYVAGVAAELAPTTGLAGTVSSNLPHGAGLSSSAALEVAVALAIGDPGPPLETARRCQRAEQRATGVPCGVMDQLAVVAGRAGHALLLDCSDLSIEHVPVPEDASIWVVHSGERRELAGSAYARRRSECEAAAALLGPLPIAAMDRIEELDDPVLAARARHVRSECRRVLEVVEALRCGDLATAGSAMSASHDSLRNDFEVSTPTLDALVGSLRGLRGVHGARLTGAGFGGCVVALTEPWLQLDGWRVVPADGARVEPA